jgi:hypothetical protein
MRKSSPMIGVGIAILLASLGQQQVITYLIYSAQVTEHEESMENLIAEVKSRMFV